MDDALLHHAITVGELALFAHAGDGAPNNADLTD